MPLQGFSKEDDSLVSAWALEVPASAAWKHFTDVNFLPEWLGSVRSGSLAAGETLVVEHGDGKESTSEIRIADPEGRLIMTWDFPEEPRSEVGVIIKSTPAGSRLDLHHVGLKDEELITSYLAGWMTHLAFFEASLVGKPLPAGSFWQVYGSFERFAHNPGMNLPF